MIANNSRIVFFGDSLTHRTGVTVSPIPACRFCLSDRMMPTVLALTNFPTILRDCSRSLQIGGSE